MIYQLREPVCQCPTLRSGVNNPLHIFSCFYFDKNIKIGRNPRDHLVQPSYFRRRENWDPEKKRIHSRSHSESVEEIRNLTFCLLLWCSLCHSKVFLPGQFPSFLCFLAASPPLHHPSFFSLCQGVCLPFLDVHILMVKISLDGSEKIPMNSVVFAFELVDFNYH